MAAPAGAAGTTAGTAVPRPADPDPAAAGPAAVEGASPLAARRSMKASTSARVTRPPLPVPGIEAGSRSLSATSWRTTGDSTRPSPFDPALPGAFASAGSAPAWGLLGTATTGGAGGELGPAKVGAGSAAGIDPAAGAGAGSAAGVETEGATGAEGAGEAAPEGDSAVMSASLVPTSTVAPSGTR